MAKRNKKQTRKIRNLVMLCSLCAVVLTVSTYAWFVGMKTVNVSRHHHHHNHHHHMHSSTSSTYYVTFEFDTGDRIELHVPRSDYGMMIEQDQGLLTFQGTRFISFERIY